MEADEREEPLLREVPLHGEPPEGIRPVEDDDRDPPRTARLHHEGVRPDEGVVPRADVGEVADHRVQAREVLVPGRQVLEALAVERYDAGSRGRDVAVPHREHVLDRAREAVLGAEEDADVEPRLGQRPRRRDESRGHRRRVDDEAQAQALQAGRVPEKDVEPGQERLS